VRERTKGRINIKLYPGVSLVQGDQTREFSALRQGVIDMAVGSTINWSPQVKELNLFSLPFLTTTFAGTDAMTQGEVGKKLFEIIQKRGAIPLAWGENGFRQVSNSKRSVTSPADLKGMKFRVVGSPLFIETFTALGANPTQMSWADTTAGLASGAVDVSHAGPTGLFQGRVQVDCYAENYSQVRAIADRVVTVLNGHRGGRFGGIFHRNEYGRREGATNEADRPYRVILDFEVNWRQS
jgi:hypothetical protein